MSNSQERLVQALDHLHNAPQHEHAEIMARELCSATNDWAKGKDEVQAAVTPKLVGTVKAVGMVQCLHLFSSSFLYRRITRGPGLARDELEGVLSNQMDACFLSNAKKLVDGVNADGRTDVQLIWIATKVQRLTELDAFCPEHDKIDHNTVKEALAAIYPNDFILPKLADSGRYMDKDKIEMVVNLWWYLSQWHHRKINREDMRKAADELNELRESEGGQEVWEFDHGDTVHLASPKWEDDTAIPRYWDSKKYMTPWMADKKGELVTTCNPGCGVNTRDCLDDVQKVARLFGMPLAYMVLS